MKTLSPDTHPEIEAIMIEGYRRMPDWKKIKCVRDLNAMMDTLAMSDIRGRHPHALEWEYRLRLASRRIPIELMKRAFNWDPDERGY